MVSSLFFKRRFANIFELDEELKDPAGFTDFPQIIRKINGAVYNYRKDTVATWGQNAESIYDAVDLWDSAGYFAGISLIHDGIKGAFFSDDNKLLFTWGLDSTIRVWQRNVDTIDSHMPPRLIKMKIQVMTGVEMDENDFNLKIIPVREYIGRRDEFITELMKYKLKAASKK